MSEYGFGVVGAGVIGAFHAAAVALVPAARLVAVTDVDPGRAEALGRRPCGPRSTRPTSSSAGWRRTPRPIPLLAPYLEYLQVKDALAATGAVVPAGMGDGQVRLTLAALAEAGFAGFVSLEPHLGVAGRFGGFSGPEGFTQAASALKALLAQVGLSWR